jgi:hypothetical protein
VNVVVTCPVCTSDSLGSGTLVDEGDAESDKDGDLYWIPALYNVLDTFRCTVWELRLVSEEEIATLQLLGGDGAGRSAVERSRHEREISRHSKARAAPGCTGLSPLPRKWSVGSNPPRAPIASSPAAGETFGFHARRFP